MTPTGPTPATAEPIRREWQRPPPPAEPLVISPFDTPHWVLAGHLGIATPYGIAGLELERSLSRLVAVAAGVGMGTESPQLAASVRVRKTGYSARYEAGYAFGFNVGLSRGDAHIDFIDEWELEGAVFINGDGYMEGRFGAFVLRFYVGAGHVTRAERCQFIDFFDGAMTCDGYPTIPYGGFAAGFEL